MGKDVHAQSRSFLLASALGAALQVLEEQAQAVASGGKARSSGNLRANLAAQLRVDVRDLRQELAEYEGLGKGMDADMSVAHGATPQSPPSIDAGLAQAMSSIRSRMAVFEASWCEAHP